jgi:hypothetical protein
MVINGTNPEIGLFFIGKLFTDDPSWQDIGPSGAGGLLIPSRVLLPEPRTSKKPKKSVYYACKSTMGDGK